MSLKLGPIPDQKPVKVTMSLVPDVHAALTDYAALHAREYGRQSSVADIAGLMIEKFLASDRQFKRARKTLQNSAAIKE